MHAEDTDDSLRVYAVNIIRHPPEPSTGKGIYLGRGLVITLPPTLSAGPFAPIQACRSLVSTCPRERSRKTSGQLAHAPHAALRKTSVDRRASDRRSSRRHGAVAYHVAAIASGECPKEVFHGDQRCCDHWKFFCLTNYRRFRGTRERERKCKQGSHHWEDRLVSGDGPVALRIFCDRKSAAY
jgi:hypothetical protein